MSKENSAGLGVNNRYGPLNTPDGAAGVFSTYGAENELVIEFSGKNINDGVISGFLPAGARPLRAILEVKTAFVMGGSTPTFNVGTSGSAGTNGVEFSEANMESTGTITTTTFGGTWGARLAADTTVVAILDGTTPTVTDAGEARLVIVYSKT
jgi:hypothetical protein